MREGCTYDEVKEDYAFIMKGRPQFLGTGDHHSITDVKGEFLDQIFTAALLYTAQHCTALHFIVLSCTALHCTALHCSLVHYTALHCTVLHCTALHCTVLHCTVLQSTH